jgi:MFS family permease
VSTINNDPIAKLDTEDAKIEKVVYTFLFLGIGSILGSSILGLIMDKFGHKASISVLLFTVLWTFIGLIIQNERHVFDWTANVTMFGAGMVDNCL